MEFTVQKRELARILRLVLGRRSVKSCDPYLRLEASAGRLLLSANDMEAEIPALIQREGVCFLLARPLLPLVRTFKQPQLTLAIEPEGLRIESYHASEDLWLALFDNPAQAPRRYAPPAS